MSKERASLESFLKALLRPILRFCLTHSISLQTLFELTKGIAVEMAAEEIAASGAKPNVSRLSVMTGLHRRDVTRLYRDEKKTDYNAGVISRVLGQWEQDSAFQTKQGKPKILSLGDVDSEFNALVRRVSTDISPAAVLFELERVGAVERTDKGLRIKHRNYVPTSDTQQGLEILSRDTDDLVRAVEENLSRRDEIPNLHGRTEYDNLAVERLPEIREWIFREGTAFHLKLRNFISQFDKDINSALTGRGGGRIVIGTFSRMSGEK